ncbi:unnamed protein product [Cochlearia groenlandica]
MSLRPSMLKPICDFKPIRFRSRHIYFTSFRPTDQVLVDYYLRLKHLGIEEGDINSYITNINICSFDPWELPSKSKSKWNDNMVWYFYNRDDEYKFNNNEESMWRTSSGYWKETSESFTPIIGKWKRNNGVKIGEKKLLIFQNHNGSEPNWVMHVYLPTFLPPHQRAYVVCKLEFKSEENDIISSGSVIELNYNS